MRIDWLLTNPWLSTLVPHYWTVTLRKPYMTGDPRCYSGSLTRPHGLSLHSQGNSFVCEGTRNIGAAVVLGQKGVVWSQALSKRHIGPKRGIMALTQALKWAKGSKTEHLHRQLICLCHSSCPKSPINLRRKNITKREMIQLLEVIWLPDELAIVP